MNLSDNIDVLVVNPTTPEMVRGSFAYMPYFVAAGLSAEVDTIQLIDDATMLDLLQALQADVDERMVLIALWTPTQVELVKAMVAEVPDTCGVFGYRPLIAKYNLPEFLPKLELIVKGLSMYPKLSRQFPMISTDEMDGHLESIQGSVFPLFTSYGCPNACTFCPASVNQPERIVLDMDVVKQNIDCADLSGASTIHFTDEDFFWSVERADRIVAHIATHYPNRFHLIALTERQSLKTYIERFGTGMLREAGFELLEVGLETASQIVSNGMNKGKADICEWLAVNCDIPILWLTLTFFPGETISSLNATGAFLRRHGFEREHMTHRMQTNGTPAGLGQFFMPYEGTKAYDCIGDQGVVLTPRPMRLTPNFVPGTFLEDTIRDVRPVLSSELVYFADYGVDWIDPKSLIGHTIEKASRFWNNPIQGLVALAIMARLEVITSKKED